MKEAYKTKGAKKENKNPPSPETEIHQENDSEQDEEVLRNTWTGFYRGIKKNGNIILPVWG